MKSPLKVLIWDKDGLPEPSDHFVVLWKNYTQNSSEQELSIPSWIAKNQDFVRNQYLSWVRKCYLHLKSNSQIYQKMQLDSTINYFQLTPFMEMNLFAKSPQIPSVLRLIAFEAWAEGKAPISIDYVGSDELLSKILQEFATRKQIAFGSNMPTSRDVKISQHLARCFRFSINSIKSPVWVFLMWMKSLPLHGSNISRLKNNSSKITFYSYYAHLSPTNATNLEFESAYWGGLPRYIKSVGKHSNWIHLSPTSNGLLAASDKRLILKKWSNGDKTQTHVSLESFFSFKIMIRIILNWHKIRSQAQATLQILTSQRIGHFNFWPFYAREFERYLTGVGLVDNLLTFELVKSSIQANSVSQQIFYLYEGQPWEKVLNAVSNQLKHELPIAVQHSTVRFWDLRYFQTSLELAERSMLEAYFPRKIVINGELSFRMLKDSPPQQELIRLESLRYNRVPSIQRDSQKSTQKFSPIILGSYLAEDNDFILRLLEEAAVNLTNIKFTFKPHPLSAKPFTSSKVNIRQSNQELWHLLHGATHVLIGSSTSAVIEVIQAKIPFAVFVPPSTVNLSPLNKVFGVEFLNTPIQLVNFLTDTSQEVFNKVKVEELVTVHANLDLWKQFIQQFE